MISAADRGEVWTIVVAAGSGSRFGAQKQFLDLGGESVVGRSVRVASGHGDGVVVVVPPGLVDDFHPTGTSDGVVVSVVAGSSSRSASVREGLRAVPNSATVVIVHDGARPLATDGIYERVLEAIDSGADAVVPVVAVTDTIRHRRNGGIDRSELVGVQTPQAFRASALRSAHQSDADATDDATLVEANGGVVSLVDGDVTNVKITTPPDLEVARLLLDRREETT